MDLAKILELLGGPVLAILTSLVVVLLWGLKKAKEEGAREERDDRRQKEVDAAHRKIREDIMPRIDALETARAEDTIRLENLKAVQSEIREDIKTVLTTVNDLAVKIAEGGRRGRSA